MIIPKKYGGMELSAYAHSCVLVKLASAPARRTTGEVQSLARELRFPRHGKNAHTATLARGEEMPCFAPMDRAQARCRIDSRHASCARKYEGRGIVACV